jgi:hypothetical protein
MEFTTWINSHESIFLYVIVPVLLVFIVGLTLKVIRGRDY